MTDRYTQRIIYFDFLRIIAVIAVMLVHTSIQNWDSVEIQSFEWHTMNIYRSFSVFGVPIFVMISGALFLRARKSVKYIYSNNIKRLTIAFIFWSLVYSVYIYIKMGRIDAAINAFLGGHYHMWFLFMIVGLYIIVPLLYPIAGSSKMTKYFLLLFFFFAILFPWTIDLLQFKFRGIADIFSNNLNNMYLHFVLGYTGYFILGYYLDSHVLNHKQRLISYLACVLGFLVTIPLSVFASYSDRKANGVFYSPFSINVLFFTIGIFIFAKYHLNKKSKNPSINKLIHVLSKCSFGAYLVHVLIIEILNNQFQINTLSASPCYMIPLLTIFVAILSFLISYLLSKIPIINQYAV